MLMEAKGTAKENVLRREFRKIQKSNEKEYIAQRTKHRNKVEHLKEKVKRRNPNPEQRKREELQALEEWVESMIPEKPPPQVPPNVHIYGEVQMSKAELACASLGPKWMDYPVLNLDNMRYEGILCHTKSRWSRTTTGSPKDQELDAQ